MRRYEVYRVDLDPVRGSEMAKMRPCVIVSPNELNDRLRTVVVAPLTSTRRVWPSRVAVVFASVAGDVALDQIRTVDKSRLARRLGTLNAVDASTVSARLVEMFL